MVKQLTPHTFGMHSHQLSLKIQEFIDKTHSAYISVNFMKSVFIGFYNIQLHTAGKHLGTQQEDQIPCTHTIKCIAKS